MANDNEKSMWDLTSGLPLEGAHCHSVAAEFTYNQEYAKNAVVLDITWQNVDDDTQDPQHQLYSVGKNWEPLEGGERVAHTSGKRQGFNNQTNIGRLIHSYITARGDGDFDKGRSIVIDEGIEPDVAAMWIGLDVTLSGVQYETMGKNADGTPKMGNTMVIGEYHGRVGDATAPAKAPAKAAGKAAKAAASAPAETNGGGTDFADHLGQALYRKLKKLAVDSADHDAFMDAAFALDEVSSDDKAWNKATERIILASDDESLFATSQ